MHFVHQGWIKCCADATSRARNLWANLSAQVDVTDKYHVCPHPPPRTLPALGTRIKLCHWMWVVGLSKYPVSHLSLQTEHSAGWTTIKSKRRQKVMARFVSGFRMSMCAKWISFRQYQTHFFFHSYFWQSDRDIRFHVPMSNTWHGKQIMMIYTQNRTCKIQITAEFFSC